MARRPNSSTKIKLQQIQEENKLQTATPITSGDNETRQEVAKKFVTYYFVILAGIIVLVPLYNILTMRLTGQKDLTLSLKDTVLTYSAVAGPTLGLVIAYYFKSNNY